MKENDYQKLTEKTKKLRSSDLMAFAIVLGLLIPSVAALYLSYTQTGWIWFISQVFLGVFILQWFFLVHDTGHGHFFATKKLNMIAGHLASFFVMLPFYPWRYIHRSHHVWTGWKDKDPTMTIIIPHKLPAWKKEIVNFCWKYWIPIFSLSFSFANFWNIPKLNRLFPDKKAQNLFSILYVPAVHGCMMWILGFDSYISLWGISFLVFLLLSDPLLISQHSGVPQYHSRGQAVTQIQVREQDDFTRSLIFPRWAQRFVLFGFNGHILHHLYPSLPGYRLNEVSHSNPHDIHWYKWLREAKSKPAIDLLFSEELNIKDRNREIDHGPH
jgi:omega-6 fatty acid desaturase (delta-12 desaturase)